MAGLPSLRQLRYLVTLADTLNFTRAAELCFVSQSTLSAGLKELESILGVQLVERDRQSVALTHAGSLVVERGRDLLSAAEDLAEIAANTSAPMEGPLRLGVIPTVAPFLIPEVMPELRKRFPKLKLSLREDLTEQLLERLRNRTLDLAVIALPYDTEGLTVKELFIDEFWLAALPNDPAIAGKKVNLPARVTERLLLLEEGHCLREHTLQACNRQELANSEGLEATSLLTLVQMVESGLGVALLPEMAIRNGILNLLKTIGRPLESPAPNRTIALVARPSSPHMREFDIIATMISDQHRQRAQAVTSPLTRRRVTKTKLR
jgi:LysR family hydrogen peroxide-inducible transcriptional activator